MYIQKGPVWQFYQSKLLPLWTQKLIKLLSGIYCCLLSASGGTIFFMLHLLQRRKNEMKPLQIYRSKKEFQTRKKQWSWKFFLQLSQRNQTWMLQGALDVSTKVNNIGERELDDLQRTKLSCGRMIRAFGSSPTPSPPLPVASCLSFSVFLCVAGRTFCWEMG